MLRPLKMLSPRSVTGMHHNSTAATEPLLASHIRTILGHAVLGTSSFLLYLLLNHPSIILLSKLGVTAWFPALGVAFAVMLAVSPRYMIVFMVADGAAGMLIYHQPLLSWGMLLGAPLGTGIYAFAAHLLRGTVKIESSLAQRRDILRYLIVSLAAAVLATLTGVGCLWADHTIQSNQFWTSAVGWYFGDAIGLLSVAPFLLIHVLPWLRKQIAGSSSAKINRYASGAEEEIVGITPLQILEFSLQLISFLPVFWFMFGRLESRQIYFLAFLPIIWIAMRQGIRGVVIGLLALNFGIVVSLRLVSVPPEVFTRLGFLMLAVSATGLALGAAVSERQRIAVQLNERTLFLDSLIANSPFGIVVQDREGKIQLFNGAFADLFLYDSAELVGRDLDELIVPPDLENETRQISAQVNAGNTVHKTAKRLRKDGQMVDVEVNALPTIQRGKVQGSYVIYKDISEQVKAAAAAQEHVDAMGRWLDELRLRTMQITLLNEMGGLLQCVESSEEAYAVVGQSAGKLFDATRSGALFILKASLNSLEATATWGSSRVATKVFAPTDCWSLRTGQPHWSEHLSQGIVCAHIDQSIPANHLCVPIMAQSETIGVLHIQFVPDGGSGDLEADEKSRESQQRLTIAVASQIGLSLANLRLRETLREQSIRDPLTGLFNRRFMQEALATELQRAKRKQRPLSLVFIDLDHFKRFNDIFGHDAGDKVLQSVANMFRSHFRADDVICRYGGEEFAIILPESSIQDAAQRMESLRMAIRELRIVHHGTALDSVTLSIGIAGFPDQGEKPQELLDCADKCLYQSKANGRDRVTLLPN